MLVVRLELWPGGDPANGREIGRINVTNDGTGSSERGNYEIDVLHGGSYFGRPGVWKRGRVLDYERKALSPYHLVLRGLFSALGGASALGWPRTPQEVEAQESTAKALGARPSTETKPCKGCGRQIRWARTDRNRPIPIEPDPILVVPIEHGRGTGLKVLLADGSVLNARKALEGEAGAVPGHESHFAHCAHAQNFRKPRGDS